ncbi:MAG: YaaR family protein [Firmicutes bacterium]|nr:YaaR family protein [Bacillota bacterium]
MVKVKDSSDSSSAGKVSSDTPSSVKGTGVASTAFLDEMQRVESKQWHEKMERLLAQIDEQAEKIKKNQTVSELYRYRDLVREFVREATRRIYQRREEGRWDRRGKFRVMSVVAEVDRHLGELTRMVLEDQQDPLAILKKLGEIRGILVDIYL